jgi:hypothetical protein
MASRPPNNNARTSAPNRPRQGRPGGNAVGQGSQRYDPNVAGRPPIGGDGPRPGRITDLASSGRRPARGLDGNLNDPGADRGSAGPGDLPVQYVRAPGTSRRDSIGSQDRVNASSRAATSQPVVRGRGNSS